MIIENYSSISCTIPIQENSCRAFPPRRKEGNLSFLKNLFPRRSSGVIKDSNLYWVYIQCEACQEKLRIHVDLRNDLSIQYGETEKEDLYFTRKQVVGKEGCFKIITVELTFDRDRKLLDRKITGGSFISQEEYDAEK